MAFRFVIDSMLAVAALVSTILLFGAAFLLILRTPKFQYSLRFLLITIGCIATALGLWTALLRSAAGPGLTGPGVDVDTLPAQTVPNVPAKIPMEPDPVPAGSPVGEPAHDPPKP